MVLQNTSKVTLGCYNVFNQKDVVIEMHKQFRQSMTPKVFFGNRNTYCPFFEIVWNSLKNVFVLLKIYNKML